MRDVGVCFAGLLLQMKLYRIESVVKRSKVITNSAAVASTTTTIKLAIPSYMLAYSANGKFGVHFKVKSHHISSIAFIRIIKVIKRMRSRRRIKREKHAHTHTHAYTDTYPKYRWLVWICRTCAHEAPLYMSFFATHALSRRFFLCECERFTALVRTTISVCMRVFVFRSIEISHNCPKIKQQKLFWLARQLFMCVWVCARVIISAGMCESYLLFLRKFFGSR